MLLYFKVKVHCIHIKLYHIPEIVSNEQINTMIYSGVHWVFHFRVFTVSIQAAMFMKILEGVN